MRFLLVIVRRSSKVNNFNTTTRWNCATSVVSFIRIEQQYVLWLQVCIKFTKKNEEDVEKQILSNSLIDVKIPLLETTMHTAKILPV